MEPASETKRRLTMRLTEVASTSILLRFKRLQEFKRNNTPPLLSHSLPYCQHLLDSSISFMQAEQGVSLCTEEQK